MKTAFFALVATLAMSMTSHAELLKLSAGDKSNNGINVSKTGAATIDGKTYDLTTVGAGLRSKKVLLINVKVYVAQLLVSSPTRFVRTDTGALKSLDDSQTVAIQMAFLRTVDASTVQVSFRDALDTNKVNSASPSIKKFLDAVAAGGDALENKTLTIVINKNSDGTETLVYEDSTGKQTKIVGNKGLTQSIFSIWLGTPDDDGVANLKAALLQVPN